MKVDQPELNLTEQKPLPTKNCDSYRTNFDISLKELNGKTVTADDVLKLRVDNLNQLECMSDNYNNCKAYYEGCRIKVNGLRERFKKE